MNRNRDRLVGLIVAVGSAGLALYSFPFVTWVAFAFFVLGVVGLLVGVWFFLRGSVRA